MATDYNYYLFEDYDTGTQFLVEDFTLGEATAAAKVYFADPSYMGECLTYDEMEESDYDVY